MDLRIAEQLPDDRVLAALASDERNSNDNISKNWQKKRQALDTEEDKQLLDLFDAEASWPLIDITLERRVEDVQNRAAKLRRDIELGLKAKG